MTPSWHYWAKQTFLDHRITLSFQIRKYSAITRSCLWANSINKSHYSSCITWKNNPIDIIVVARSKTLKKQTLFRFICTYYSKKLQFHRISRKKNRVDALCDGLNLQLWPLSATMSFGVAHPRLREGLMEEFRRRYIS